MVAPEKTFSDHSNIMVTSVMQVMLQSITLKLFIFSDYSVSENISVKKNNILVKKYILNWLQNNKSRTKK